MPPRAARPQAVPPLEDRLVDAAMALAAAGPWTGVHLADIARAAGVDLAALYPGYRSKADILGAFIRRVDRSVLTAIEPEAASDPARDRLFDVLMRRFEVLAPYRPALRSIADAARRDGVTLLSQLPGFAESMRWMLRAARIETAGVAGAVRVAGVMAVMAAVMPRFLDDDDDLARTMAALDRYLTRGEKILRPLRRSRVTSAEGHGIV